jgi:uroporphyrinogen decarboxylase
MKNLFQKTLGKEVVSTPPVWMMRQAGRYHSHYQNLKLKHTFMDLCLQPELAAEVAMGPVQDFDFDAAILFSDILFPLKALGMPLDYTDGGPKLGFHLNSTNIKNLKPWQEAWQEMSFQKEAMKLTRERLQSSKGLIGFVGGPWTLFVYAMEGGHAGNLLTAKTNWELWTQFSEIISQFLIENIRLQFEGGADVVMLFDTAAGELSPGLFQAKIQPVLAKIAQRFPGKLGYYSKGTSPQFFDSQWKKLPWAGQGHDHRNDLVSILNQSNGFVQGNFDQSLLHLSETEFPQFFREYLKPFQELSKEQRKGWVCGLGHGVLPKTPEKNVHAFVDIVRKTFL